MSTGFLEGARALLFKPMTPDDRQILLPSSGRVTTDGNIILDEEAEHLGCFLGGIYAVSGKLFSNKDYIDIGAKLTLGCVYGYESFPTGMMPERINMVACQSPDNCTWDQQLFDEAKQKRPECMLVLFLNCTYGRPMPISCIKPNPMKRSD